MSECGQQSLPIKSWMWVIVAHLEGAFANHDREWSWLTFFVIVIWNSRSFPITCFVNMSTYILIKNSKKGTESLKILHNKMVKNRGQTFQNSSQQNGKKGTRTFKILLKKIGAIFLQWSDMIANHDHEWF